MTERKIIDAFHPDYIKIYAPQFLKSIRASEAYTTNSKLRTTRESVNAQSYSISAFPLTKATRLQHQAQTRKLLDDIKQRMLQPANFHVYGKAIVSKIDKDKK
jgi:hypothetical protein